MEKIWKFYDHMNEIVYASDMDTYELQYMNQKALDTYGYMSLDEVKGKKCYEVLQGRSSPCTICTNDCLQPGYFHEWKYYNPVIGKTFALKDTMLVDGDRRCRMEMAIDVSTQEQQKKAIKQFTDNESMINEGLRIALAESTPEESIQVLLEYLGKALKSERVYIFEKKKNDTFDNTYEWCAGGVAPQKENLQDVPYEAVAIWHESFLKNQNVIIKDVELIKDTDPAAYEYLVPQEIRSLVASPLIDKGEIVGFYGVDNPPAKFLEHISTMFWILGHFMGSLLKRRNLVKKLESLSYYDQLTGVGNRHAMNRDFETIEKKTEIGMLYCDVMGLKLVNDTEGHKAGDELLIRACECLKKHFEEEELFRIGGDEFIVLYKGKSRESFSEKIALVREEMVKNQAVMALGDVWDMVDKTGMDALLARADEKMYEEKRAYYAKKENNRREMR